MSQNEAVVQKAPMHPHMARVLQRRNLIRMGEVEEFFRTGLALAERGKQIEREMKQREDLTAGTAQGFYNPGQLLFDICGDNDLTSLTMAGSYSPLFDVIGFDFSNVYKVEESFITYIASAGAAASSPASGVLSAACAPGNGVEWGHQQLRHSGWTSLGRKSPVRDITEMDMRLCESSPRYRVDGSIINDDFEWDMVTMMSVMMQDMHRLFVTGNAANDNEANGIQRLIKTGVTDTDGNPFPQMDSFIVDWNGNAMAPNNGAVGVTLNGSAVDDGYVLIDFINSWVRHTVGRINMAPTLAGQTPMFTCMLPTEALSAFIYAYANYAITGNTRITVNVNNEDVIAMRNRLIREAIDGTVTLVFEGYPVTFIPWDWETIDEVTGNVDMYFLTNMVGTTPLVRLNLKDMRRPLAISASNGTANTMRYVLDGGRVLGHKVEDHTCEYVTARLDFRPLVRAPWAMMKVTDVAVNSLFGHLSPDPLSSFFPGAGSLAVNPAASSVTTLGNAGGMPA